MIFWNNPILSQNILAIVPFIITFLLAYFLQYKFVNNKFKISKMNSYSKLYDYGILIMASVLLTIITGLSLKVGGNITKVSFSIAVTILFTLWFGPFYSVLIVFISNTLAFFIFPASSGGPFLLSFTVVSCITPLITSAIIIPYKFWKDKYFIALIISTIFIFIGLLILVCIEVFSKGNYKEIDLIKKMGIWAVICISLLLATIILLFGFWWQNKKQKWISALSLGLVAMFWSFVWLSWLADPILLHFTYSLPWQMLYVSRIIKFPIEFILNSFLFFYLTFAEIFLRRSINLFSQEIFSQEPNVCVSNKN